MKPLKKSYSFLLTSLSFATLIYLSGCGDDKTPAVNSAPEFEEETYTFEIAENASSGDALGTVSATDENASDILAYSITTSQTNFAMNTSTGEITLAADAVLDYEAVVSYTLQVQVSDGATPALTATAEITINVGDVNEFNPEFAQASYSFSLAADAAVGDEVGKIAATDSDGTAQLTYTLSGEEADNFAITDGTNVASGEEASVVVAANADLTSLVSPVKITITVSDGSNTSDAEVEITIAPVGTNAAPIFANTSYSFNVASDATEGAVVGTVSATDEDEGAMLTYSLSGTDAGSFAISNTPVPSGEAVPITVATGADLPSLTSPVKITVTADDGGNTATANVEITITAGNVAPVFANTPYTFNVASDAADEAVVGTVSATDEDEGAMLTYSLSGTEAGSFAISNTAVASGEEVSITVATNADLSSLTNPVMLTIEVSDGTDQVTANVEITIIAGNVAPVFDQTAYTFSVASDAAAETPVGTVSATDSNAGAMLKYSLSGTDAGHFAIDNTAVTSGTAVSVTVATNADLPSLTSPVALTVEVSDGTDQVTANVEITIIAGNVAPVFASTDYAFSVASDAAAETPVGTVSATDSNDGDLLAYSLSGEGADNFAISNAAVAVASGTDVPITVAANADLSSLGGSVTLTVTVADNATPALMATANVEITILEGNVAPVFGQTAYTFSIDEDAESGDVVDVVSATDSNAGNLLAYTLSGEGADNFAIDNTAVASGTPVQITVSGTASLDHETTTSYTLEVQASDDAVPTLTATAAITINVGDVNDNDPAFAQASYIFNVDENSPASTLVGTVAATDADAGTTLAYSIVGTQTDFEMDASTGEIKVASASLDFETTTSYTLEVEASDGATPARTATADVTINVDDVNDNGPVFTGARYTFNVNENSAVSTMVGTVVATDADAGMTLQYSITTTPTDFDIDSGTGEMTVASAALDFETTTSYTLEVKASDGASPPLTATAEVTINVNDLNDETPVFGETAYTFEVVGVNAESGDEVGTVAATDADAGATLEYSITNTQTEFDIDANTGIITVSDAATLSTATPSYTLMMQVDDGANIAMANVTITIVGVDYDVDGDGLIDINTLEQLNAMRYDLDGNGEVDEATDADAYATAFPDAATFDPTPTGYELLRSLDFDATDSYADATANMSTWTTLDGWPPIGIGDDASSYVATFDGNGKTLSNLFINTSVVDGVGLFEVLGNGAIVRNIGVVDVDITNGNTSSSITGALVSINNAGATIIACYATGTVSDEIASGGSSLGGLVGINKSMIMACYATCNVTGKQIIGGLVGTNENAIGGGVGVIIACYATGQVESTGSGLSNVAGLAGTHRGTITACYSTGDVAGIGNRGGLVGNGAGTVTASYFNSTVNDDLTEGSQGKAATALQMPTAYGTGDTDIYSTWNADLDNGLTKGVDDATAAGDTATDDPWDFGTSSQYPVLKVDFDGDGMATAAEFGTQPRG